MSTNAIIFISLSVLLSAVSLAVDRRKTLAGFKRGWNMFKNVLVPFLSILVLVSILLYLIPPSVIVNTWARAPVSSGFPSRRSWARSPSSQDSSPIPSPPA